MNARVALLSFVMLIVAGWNSTAQAVLEAYWKFNETSGPIAADSSGNTHNGTLQNGPTWDTSGVFSGAVSLDGLNDYVEVPDTSTLKYSGGNMTLSTWVNLVPSETGGYVISKPWNASGRYNYTITVSGSPNTTIGFNLVNSGEPGQSASIGSPAYASFAGTWHQLTAVADSSNNMTLYVDGAVAATGVYNIANWADNDINQPLALGTLYPYGGAWGGHNGFSVEGKLDDLGMFDQALTTGEAKSIFNLAMEPALNYDLGQANQLIQAFESSAPSIQIGDQLWMLVSDGSLTSPEGEVSLVSNQMHYSINFANGNGFAVFNAPEPSSQMIFGCGAICLAMRTRRRRNGANATSLAT